MLLHWRQLVLHYGADVAVHEPKFMAASQTTYGLLCCRFVPGDPRLSASAGEHAEQRLLASPDWTIGIPEALRSWTPQNSPIVTTLALNRSPCKNCTRLLVEALHKLHHSFPVACDRNRFVLACRGVYEDAAMLTATTVSDLRALLTAGWEVCVLQVGPAISDRGQILLKGLEGLGQRGLKRLDS